ncbi:MAG TPA: hypothetical protein VMD02_06150 [Candidatus Omnitrophota bacterium]|nr:hypothetical protein [Candidatus Omnitrophota bacterium]
MKIGIDIDNVIANTFVDLAARFNEYMGRELSPSEVVEVMRREKLRMWGYWFLTWRKRLLTQVSVIDGAGETIREWHREHEIVLVTSRLPVLNRQTRQWLAQNSIPYHELHHSKETLKHRKSGACDIFIEDNLEECQVLADHCPTVFLMDHPWNRRPLGKSNIVRVSGWGQIREALKH